MPRMANARANGRVRGILRQEAARQSGGPAGSCESLLHSYGRHPNTRGEHVHTFAEADVAMVSVERFRIQRTVQCQPRDTKRMGLLFDCGKQARPDARTGGFYRHVDGSDDNGDPFRPTSASWSNPQFSRDGRRLAADIFAVQRDVFTHDWARDTLTRVTFGGGLNAKSVWTPDPRLHSATETRNQRRMDP